MPRPPANSSANRQPSKAPKGGARSTQGSSQKAAASTVSQRPQRQAAARRVLSDQAVHGNKATSTSKRHVSPSAEAPSVKRRKRNTTRDENTNPIRNGRMSKGKGSHRAHTNGDPANDDNNDNDDDEVFEDDEDDDAIRSFSEDEQDLVEDDDVDDEDPRATAATMLGSDDEDLRDIGSARTVKKTRTMSARERARRDEEPVLSESDNDEHPLTGPASPSGSAHGHGAASASTSIFGHSNAATSTAVTTIPPSGPTPAQAPAPIIASGATLGWADETNINEKTAFEYATDKLFFDNAFPETNIVSLINRQALVEAAEACGAHGIRARLLGDPSYSLRFDPRINTRVSLVRSQFKQCAGDVVVGFYNLPNDETRKEVADKLLVEGTFHFAQKNDGTFIDTLPFSHRCIQAIIQTVVFSGNTRRSLSRKHLDSFVRISQDGARLELPIPMVATAAAAVAATLDDYRQGLVKPSPFTIDTARTPYKDYVQQLEDLRLAKEPAFHRLMADLFKEASGAKLSSSNGVPRRSLAPINIDAMAV
ncbi:hypothetical protein EV122DRAFT_284206 [Schizophyllum commune]